MGEEGIPEGAVKDIRQAVAPGAERLRATLRAIGTALAAVPPEPAATSPASRTPEEIARVRATVAALHAGDLAPPARAAGPRTIASGHVPDEHMLAIYEQQVAQGGDYGELAKSRVAWLRKRLAAREDA
jgi:hypothetical protein